MAWGTRSRSRPRSPTSQGSPTVWRRSGRPWCSSKWQHSRRRTGRSRPRWRRFGSGSGPPPALTRTGPSSFPAGPGRTGTPGRALPVHDGCGRVGPGRIGAGGRPAPGGAEPAPGADRAGRQRRVAVAARLGLPGVEARELLCRTLPGTGGPSNGRSCISTTASGCGGAVTSTTPSPSWPRRWRRSGSFVLGPGCGGPRQSCAPAGSPSQAPRPSPTPCGS